MSATSSNHSSDERLKKLGGGTRKFPGFHLVSHYPVHFSGGDLVSQTGDFLHRNENIRDFANKRTESLAAQRERFNFFWLNK